MKGRAFIKRAALEKLRVVESMWKAATLKKVRKEAVITRIIQDFPIRSGDDI